MTPEVQAALSVAYSADTFSFQELSSGRFALYDRQFRLQNIGTWDEVLAMYRARAPYVPPHRGLDLGDLRIDL